MRMLAPILTVVIAISLVNTARSQDRANPPANERAAESAKKIQELQKERIAALKDMVEMTEHLFKAGRGSPRDVFEAKVQAFQAERDAAEKMADRIAFSKKLVESLREYEQWATEQRLAARDTMVGVLKVKTRRLEAEIELEKLKAKDASGTK